MNNENQKNIKKTVKDDPYSSFTVGSVIILAILLLCFFFGWSYIYNTEPGVGVEIGINGWNYICLGFTNAFKSTNKTVFGDVDSFYYWVKNWVKAETIITFVAFWLVIGLIAVSVMNIRKTNRKLALASAIGSIVLALVFLACFVIALTMTPKMVKGFCGGNKSCSVHSLALIPFFVTVGNAVTNFALHHKMSEAPEIR